MKELNEFYGILKMAVKSSEFAARMASLSVFPATNNFWGMNQMTNIFLVSLEKIEVSLCQQKRRKYGR